MNTPTTVANGDFLFISHAPVAMNDKTERLGSTFQLTLDSDLKPRLKEVNSLYRTNKSRAKPRAYYRRSFRVALALLLAAASAVATHLLL